MKRAVVVTIARIDEALDEVLYRPAVVKAFAWLPRWWLCDLAKLSIALDERWGVGYWNEEGMRPGGPCHVCGRRASIHTYGGLEAGEPAIGSYLETHPAQVCGWCHLRGRMADEAEVRREFEAARADSIAWRWRWRVRP
jgi:hypothetical protein